MCLIFTSRERLMPLFQVKFQYQLPLVPLKISIRNGAHRLASMDFPRLPTVCDGLSAPKQGQGQIKMVGGK